MCSVNGQSVDLFTLKHQLVGVSIFPILSGDVRNVCQYVCPSSRNNSNNLYNYIMLYIFVYGHATRFQLW